ncbi:hypothetical protein D3C71_2171750 [compost metagenome]
MQLGSVLFKMISGDVQMALGYKNFFLWVLVSAIPVLVLSRFIRVGPKEDADQPDLGKAEAKTGSPQAPASAS